jgi:hypothetical protein
MRKWDDIPLLTEVSIITKTLFKKLTSMDIHILSIGGEMDPSTDCPRVWIDEKLFILNQILPYFLGVSTG